MTIEVFKIKEELMVVPFDSISNPEQFAELLHQAYWKHDIVKELKKMRLWLHANPKKAKKNYKRFITNWLAANWRDRV